MDAIKKIDQVFNIVGILNPAMVALKYFQTLEIPVNEQSFYDVAKDLEDYTGEGFIVDGVEEIQKLSEIGKFVVCSDENGVIRAKTVVEWLELAEKNNFR